MAEFTEKEIATKLQAIEDGLSRNAEKALKEQGKLRAELKAEIDSALTAQAALKAQLKELQQQQDAGVAKAKRAKSWGERVVSSKEFKAYTGSGNIAVRAEETGGGTGGDTPTEPETPEAPTFQTSISAGQWAGYIAGGVRRLFLRDLIGRGKTGDNSIGFGVESWGGAAGVQSAEGASKADAALIYTPTTALVQTIAATTTISKQAMDDEAFVASLFEGRLKYGVDLAEDELIASEILKVATAYSAPTGVASAANKLDELRIAILQAYLSDFDADAIALNAIDLATIEMLKDDDGKYIFPNAPQVGLQTIWGRPTVTTKGVETGKFIVGNFGMGASLIERSSSEVAFFEQHADYALKNLILVRAEKRAAIAVWRPSAFVKGSFAASYT